MKKRADLLLVKEHSQQQARTGEDWLRQEDREPTDGESDTNVYQVGKQGQVPHSRSALRSQQHHLRRIRQQD